MRLVELKLRQRQGTSAAAIFAEHVWPGGAPEATRTSLLSRITLAHTDNEARHAFLSGLLRDVPDDRFVLLKLAAMRFRVRDRDAAERLFAAARALGELPVESQLMELELHLVAMRFEEAYAVASALHARMPDRPDFARRAIQAAHFCGRMSDMLALIEAALRRWPRDWLLVFRYNRCTIPLASDRALYDLLAEQVETVAGDERWLFQFAIASLRHGETSRAMTIIDAIPATSPVAHMALPLRAALHAHPASRWKNVRGISNAPEEDVQVVRTADAIATVVLLAGVQGGLGYLPFGMADGLLAQRSVNVVYLRDLNNRGFTSGVRRFGTDQTAMIEGLGELCQTLGAPVVTMGASLGGVAAIRTAAKMHAHAAISFAGGIHLGVDATDEEAPAAASGMRASLFSGVTQAESSIVALIRSAPRTRIHQCFGAEYAPDVESAALLRDVPNAVLHPQPGCADHFVIEHMIAGSGLFAVLDQAVAMPAPGAP
ncbi:MAG: hypothetical protein HWD60_00435 [Defluviicoccus sp.]|nr:MAG: hypothetical protein HWD60_00435 [Defluviicoccus sp.]